MLFFPYSFSFCAYKVKKPLFKFFCIKIKAFEKNQNSTLIKASLNVRNEKKITKRIFPKGLDTSFEL